MTLGAKPFLCITVWDWIQLVMRIALKVISPFTGCVSNEAMEAYSTKTCMVKAEADWPDCVGETHLGIACFWWCFYSQITSASQAVDLNTWTKEQAITPQLLGSTYLYPLLPQGKYEVAYPSTVIVK